MNIFNVIRQFVSKSNSTKVKSNTQPIDKYPDTYHVDGWGVKHPIRNSSLEDYINHNEFAQEQGLTSEDIAKLVEELTEGKKID